MEKSIELNLRKCMTALRFKQVIVMGIAKHTAVLCVEVVLRRSLCGAGGEKKCGEQGAEKFFHRVFLISELF